MAQAQNDRPQAAPPKSLMTAGPTLHYSHANVRTFFIAVNIFYFLTCVLWSKLFADSWFTLTFARNGLSSLWLLGQYVRSPISIFEYPWQIVVLGLVMGIMAAVPPLVSQLFSFIYCLPLLASLALFAHLPAFALCVLVGCFLIASRPLRFRSRIISFALCVTPQMLYWAAFGGSRNVDPLIWGFSFAPWIFAWLVALVIAGEVLLVGHFTRYRPGMISLFSALTLLLAFGIFQYQIGLDELAYQRYVVKNNPENIIQFHDHSITEAIDETIRNPATAAYLAQFYSSDPDIRRREIKDEVILQLSYGRWPPWMILTDEIDFTSRRQYLFQQYENYISDHDRGRRMPIALYYKAILTDLTPDLASVEENEVLRFRSDYSSDTSSIVWYELNRKYPDSPESIEARLRLAIRYAGSNNLEYARQLLAEAIDMVPAAMQRLTATRDEPSSYFTAFTPTASSALTPVKLAELEFRLKRFRDLISEQNVIAGDTASRLRLADFVLINPYAHDYKKQLDVFAQRLKSHDPLMDNVLLAQALLIKDFYERSLRLQAIVEGHPNTDGGIAAMYELGRIQVRLWKDAPDSDPDRKLQMLADSRATLTRFVQLYPNSIWIERARNLLRDLPSIESTEAAVRPVPTPRPM